MDSAPRPELFDFHGVSAVRYFTDSWEKVQSFQARPDDILIATYPKAGRYTNTMFCSSLRRGQVTWHLFLFRNHLGLLHPGPALLWSDISRASDFHPHLWQSPFFGNQRPRFCVRLKKNNLMLYFLSSVCLKIWIRFFSLIPILRCRV